jgi:ketosteroid isomerase-like protein
VSENLDLVRSIVADWERGEFFSRADWADPDIEYVVADGPEPGTWRGVGEMAAAFRDLLGAWEDFRVRADEYREVDDEQVLVLQHNSGRGKSSGLPMWAEAAIIFDLRDGKVTRCVGYMDRDRALADLGLEA